LATAAVLVAGCGGGAAPETQLLELGSFATSIFGVSPRNLKPKPPRPSTAARSRRPQQREPGPAGYQREGATLTKPGGAVNQVVDAGDGVLGDNGTVSLRDFQAGSLGTGFYDCG
jgi:hypothetical protein